MFGSSFSTLSPSFVGEKERKKKVLQVNLKLDLHAEDRCPCEVSFQVSRPGRGNGYPGVIASLMSLIEVAQFYYFLI